MTMTEKCSQILTLMKELQGMAIVSHGESVCGGNAVTQKVTAEVCQSLNILDKHMVFIFSEASKKIDGTTKENLRERWNRNDI